MFFSQTQNFTIIAIIFFTVFYATLIAIVFYGLEEGENDVIDKKDKDKGFGICFVEQNICYYYR